MAIVAFGSELRAALHAFRGNARGNVAITFALAVIPIFGAVGVAVDYSRANSARTAMQASLDATALMLAKEIGTTSLTSTQISTKASNYFAAQFNRPEARNVQITSSFDTTTNRVTVTGSATVDTTVAAVLGIQQLPISSTSVVVAGLSKKVEIALVLDNTGSMATSGKIDALKSASHQFLSDLQKLSKQAGDIKVAIIPFDYQVKPGTGLATKPWMDWSYVDTSGGGGDDSWDGRRDNTKQANIANWRGCVTDRTQPYDAQDTTPGSDPATWYPAVNCDLPAMLPLTYDWTALHAKVDEMKPAGKTNLTIGLVWGWHALTPNDPLTEAAAPSNQILKYLVFLTDGLNTQNRWTTTPVDIDARTQTVCSNIKASTAQIRLYTIRVIEGNETLLRACASDPTQYYNVTMASQLSGVFAAIFKELTQIRIAR